MSELKAIKEEIFNRGLLKPLLESVGCEEVRQNQNRMEGARPDGDNNRGFSVYIDEDLNSKVWTRNIETTDIFDLISYFKFGKETKEEIKRCLPKSKEYIVNTLKLDGYKDVIENELPDYNFHLRKQKKKAELQKPNEVLPESIMKGFVSSPHMKWILEDGVSCQTQEIFEVGFDIQTCRIIFPVRNINGEIVGVRGRATRKEEEDKAKYLPIYSFYKSRELFNLHRAMHYIRKFKTIILFESEKSCMLAHQFGFYNTVAIMGSDLSDTQIALIKSVYPNLKIVAAFDKDKTVEKVRQMLHKLQNYQNLYSIYDKDDLLEWTDEKADAPVDKGKDTWLDLYKNNCYRVKF